VNAWKFAALRDADLETEVAALYNPALPYHNFQHALSTLGAAEIMLGRCVAEGIRVDPQIVYLALLFHDAGYHEDHRALGFASKEAYSAELAQRGLARRRATSRVIGKVVSAVMSTMRDATFVTAEQKVVRAADLSGLAADYDIFLGNTRRLWDEYEMLRGSRPDWPAWVCSTTEVVRHYLSQEIRLTSYFSNESGESVFHARALANLQRLQQEPPPRID
jgi:predicted metal-dependent HD superfamily phosphohydrolase